MPILIDTGQPLYCEICDCLILPDEPKVILGECIASGRQILVILHPECMPPPLPM